MKSGRFNVKKLKIWNRFFISKSKKLKKQVEDSPAAQNVKTTLSWSNLKPRLEKYRDDLAVFTREQPKTAAFIYVCLFCAFSIRFLDRPFALWRLKNQPNAFFDAVSVLNPSGWWFFILLFLWLFFMAVAGLSLTTDAFEKNLVKARMVAFIFLTLALSSALTLFLSALTGRYAPALLGENLYGFVAFRFKAEETSFPSFAVQSIWAVMTAAGSFYPQAARILWGIAAFVTFCVIMAAGCFLSDAVMGAYIGIMMYFTAEWLISRNRENSPLISL